LPDLRIAAAILATKAAANASRRLGRGGGTAIGGLVGLRLAPGLVEALASQLGRGSIAITGTNGKTTTSRLVAETARRAGLEPLANASGSNLQRGLASTLALEAGLDGRPRHAERRLGVLEVDEATLPHVLREVHPRVVVFTNLFRDQLDRYGEVEAVASLWREALNTAPSPPRLVLNADDPTVAALGEERPDSVYFGVEDRSLDTGRPEHAADALNCRCGARLEYGASFFGHTGHWRCPGCGRSRPEPWVRATEIDLRDGRSLRFHLSTPSGDASIDLALGGLYNVYNALAAAAAADALALPFEALTGALGSSTAAFGRQEAFEVDGRRVELFLGKNPAGLNQVLATLLLDSTRRNLLVILNDGIADGRDISWVWDADFEVAAARFEHTVVSGLRAWDMALRLKYAEWPETTLQVEPDIATAFEAALAATPLGACLSVVPTYTAMLELRDLLARRTGRARFWQQR
jgi:UDP-N-acetylmuramyl tripeptide synthase